MSEYNTDRVFPYYHWPGTDLISKLVLTDKQVINMLSKALVPEMAEDSYEKKKCDVLYTPCDPLIDDIFLTHDIQYCTFTYERHNRLPIIVIFGITSAKVFLLSKFVDSDLPFARQISSIGWAEPVGYFLCSQSLSISTLDYGKNDFFVRLLYSIAHDSIEQLVGEEAENWRR
ncbi:hypothetical protein AB4K20DRAFT_1976633 [Rhizopus microsporus]